MRSLLIFGAALGAITLSSTAAMAADSPAAAIVGTAQAGAQAMGHGMTMHRWGTRIGGHWIGGVQAPGGWAAYRRPTVGVVLPSYWIGSGFFIGNYGLYGLPAPHPGYVWARYYDDAVLVDRNGRVYDSRGGIDWGRYEGGYADGTYSGYADAPPPPLPYVNAPYPDGGYAGGPPPPTNRSGNGGAVTGAVVGGVAGGVIGNVVAGKGDRTAGTIVGAAVGAVAGAAIGSASDRANDRPRGAPPPPPGATYRDDRPYDGDYRDGPPRRGEEPMRGPRWMTEGGPPPMAYDAPRGPMPMPMYPPMHGPGEPHITTYTTPGYAAAGYWYPGTTVTTITFPPVTTVTKTVTYTTVRRVVHKRPAPKRRCGCR